MKTRKRLVGGLIVAVALGVAAAWFWAPPRPIEERVLRLLPERQAIHAFIDPRRLEDSPLARLGPAASEWSAKLRVLAPIADGLAFSIDSGALHAAAVGEFSDPFLRAYLKREGVDCVEPLVEAPCAVPALDGAGEFLLRLPENGALTARYPADAPAADADTAEGFAPRLRRSLEAGALLWLHVDPARLDRALRDAPDRWANFSLVSRALIRASAAYVEAFEEPGGGLRMELTAECPDEEAASELASVLAGLNSFAAAMLEKHGDEGSKRWIPVLTGFRSERAGAQVRGRWSIPD